MKWLTKMVVFFFYVIWWSTIRANYCFLSLPRFLSGGLVNKRVLLLNQKVYLCMHHFHKVVRLKSLSLSVTKISTFSGHTFSKTYSAKGHKWNEMVKWLKFYNNDHHICLCFHHRSVASVSQLLWTLCYLWLFLTCTMWWHQIGQQCKVHCYFVFHLPTDAQAMLKDQTQ